MLLELDIRDLAIIETIHLVFTPGFITLTGETGAGKSIIIDAMELVLGGRADREVVRAGADSAQVEAVFRLDPTRQRILQPILEREGLEGDEPDILLLSREVRVEGRNICRVNGRAVTLALLREISEGLVDIHGQSEHLSLYRVREHLNLLDRYGGLWELRQEVSAMVSKVNQVRRERAALQRDEEELARRVDLLQFQVNEIAAANLQPGEEETLREERTRLANAEQLSNILRTSLHALEEGSEEETGAVDQLGAAVRALEKLVRIDATMEERLREAEDLVYRTQDLAGTLREYQEQLEFSPRRLAQVEERLDLIRRLERKYGQSIPDVLAYAVKAAKELDSITRSEERIEELLAEEEHLLQKLGQLTSQLSLRRREASLQMAQGVETELQDLRMAGARFAVDFQHKPDPRGVPVEGTVLGQEAEAAPQRMAFDSTGIDQVEFLVSPNPGEPPKPMAKIASGGETSRLMLALKAVLSRADETPTLVFDEIDQGIGGRVGATVGAKLWRLTIPEAGSTSHQVLCVTHLPQLAGFGDMHLKVGKQVVEGRTITQVTSLQEEPRIDELAQMLGAETELTRRNAVEILREAEQVKGQLRNDQLT